MLTSYIFLCKLYPTLLEQIQINEIPGDLFCLYILYNRIYNYSESVLTKMFLSSIQKYILYNFEEGVFSD